MCVTQPGGSKAEVKDLKALADLIAEHEDFLSKLRRIRRAWGELENIVVDDVPTAPEAPKP